MFGFRLSWEGLFCKGLNLDIFKKLLFERLLPSFSTIEQEAEDKENELLKHQNEIFDPDIHDQGDFEEHLFYEKINYQITQSKLKQDLLNSYTVSLFHILERELDEIFSTYHSEKDKRKHKEELSAYIKRFPSFNKKYDIDNDPNWENLLELRDIANAVKHGKGRSFNNVKKQYPHLINKNGEICVDEDSIKKYIQAMRNFWENAFIFLTN